MPKQCEFKRNFSGVLLILVIFLSTYFSYLSIGFLTNEKMLEVDSNKESIPNRDFTALPLSSNVEVLGWWNDSFPYRKLINISEPNIIDRNEPIVVFLTFDDLEHYNRTTRIVRYEQGPVWTEVISQIWNQTYNNVNYISSLSVAFTVNLLKGSNALYFVYYSDQPLDDPSERYLSESHLQISTIGSPAIDSIKISNGLFNLSLNKSSGFNGLEVLDKNFHRVESMSPNHQILPNQDLLANWKFNEGSGLVAIDSSGNGYSATIGGSVSYTSGKISTGLNFPGGNNDHVTASFSRGTILTFSMWATYTSGKRFMFISGSANVGPGLLFESSTGKISWRVWDTGSNVIADIPASANDGNYHHYVLIVSSATSTVKLYYDNALIGQGNYVQPNLETTFNIGGLRSGPNNYHWVGKIDEFRVYNRELTESEIATLYRETAPTVINSINIIKQGPVFVELALEWTAPGDMTTKDVITVYNLYHSYSLERSFYWNTFRNQTNNQWQALNTNYNSGAFYGTTLHRFHYDYGNAALYTQASTFVSQNYSVVRGPLYESGTWTSLGVFLTGFEKGNTSLDFSWIEWLNTRFQFIPGNRSDLNNKGANQPSTYNLTLKFWEMLMVGDSFSSNYDTASNYIHQIYQGLKSRLSYSVGTKENVFFDLLFNLYDNDNLGASNVNVSLYNTTENWSGIYSQYASKLSDSQGKVAFYGLKQMNLTINITYSNPYDGDSLVYLLRTLNITLNSSQTLTIENLNLTRAMFNARNKDTSDILAGARLEFYWKPVDGTQVYIGAQNTDLNGNASLYFFNKSAAEGNYSIKLYFFGEQRAIRFGTEGSYVSELNFTMQTLLYQTINVDLGSTSSFETDLIANVSTLFNTHYYGDVIWLKYNYTQVVGETETLISGATISLAIFDGTNTVYSANVNEVGSSGEYVISLDTQVLNITAGRSYIINALAQKAGFTTSSHSILMNINPIETQFSLNQTAVTKSWNEQVFIMTQFNRSIGTAIENANISYTCSELPSFNGSLFTNEYGQAILQINTSNFVIGTYTIIVTAQKLNYESKTQQLSITVSVRPTGLLIEQQTLNVIWLQNISMRVAYRDNLTNTNIPNAELTYEVGQGTGISGSFIEIGQTGVYEFTLNSTNFILSGIYTITIEANLQFHQTRTQILFVKIDQIQTRINGTIALTASATMNVTTLRKFVLNYTDVSGIGITNANDAFFEWQYIGNDTIYRGELNELGNGLYELDFKSQCMPIGEYAFVVSIGKLNYIDRKASISVRIVPIPMNIDFDLGENQEEEFRQIVGEILTIEFDLIDTLYGDKLSGANAWMMYKGLRFNFTESTPGHYRVEIDTSKLNLNVVFAADTDFGEIYIEKANYTIPVKKIAISIAPPEYVIGNVGVPQVFVHIAIISIFGTIGLVFAYRGIVWAKMPVELKKIIMIEKMIKNHKPAPESNVFATFEELRAQSLQEDLKLLGLLEESREYEEGGVN